MTTTTTAARTPEIVRAEIAVEMASAKRGARRRERIECLEFELGRLTATDAINARRAEMGLAPWSGAS